MVLRKFDYFSPLITLYFKGEARHSSSFSGIISIIFTFFVFIVCIYVSYDFLFKKNPTSYYLKREIKDIGTININNDNFFHFLTFIDDENNEDYYNDKVFSVIGINNNSLKDFDLYNFISQYSYSHYIYELCEKLNISNSLYEKNFNKSLCISKYYDKNKNKIINSNEKDFPFPKLQNNINDNHILYYGILIKECENNTLYNNNSCYDINTIKKITFSKDRKYTFNYYSNFFDIENYNKPIITQLSKITFTYNPYFIKKNEINLFQLFLKTTTGIFMDKNKENKILNLEYYNYEYTYNFLNTFCEINQIKVSNKIEIYHRIYKKFQDIIGSIDGTIGLLIFIIEILNDFFYHDFRLINDFNKVIGEKVEKIKKKEENIRLSPSNNITSQILLNNFVVENFKLSKFSNKNVPNVKCSLFQTKNVNNLTNNNKIFSDSFINYEKIIVKNYQIFSWLQYMKSVIFCFKKKKYKYYDKILLLRKNILSEERLLKNYWNIKKINKGLFDVKIKSDNPSICTYK